MEKRHNDGQFLLQVDMGDDPDPDQLDQLTRQLQSEIIDQGIDSIDLVRGDQIPEGAKSAEAVTWGMLAVSVLPNLLPKLIDFLQSWTMRGESRKVRIMSKVGDHLIELEYTPSGVDKQDLKELISVLTASSGVKRDQHSADLDMDMEAG